MYVRERDHVRALSLLDAAAASTSRADFVVKVMPALRSLFHADEVGHAEVFTDTGQVASSVGFPTPVSAQADALRVWESRSFEHPWVAHVTRSGLTGSVRLTELCSRTELSRSAFYQDFFRPRGVEHADYQTVSMCGGRIAGFSLCRNERDFSGDEHDLFEHLRRPLSHIWQLVSRVEAFEAGVPTAHQRIGEALTPAERRVSVLVLRGWRTVPIAQALGVSPKAVEQHLTRIYRKAAVNSRAEYITRLLRLENEAPRPPA